MYPGAHAKAFPEKSAVINATTGQVLNYQELNQGSNQLAQFLHAQGLRAGDHIAILMENHLRFFEISWAAFRSGLFVTAINYHLTAEEAAYIVNDSGAQALVTSSALKKLVTELSPLIPACRIRLMIDGVIEGWDCYEASIADSPSTPLNSEPRGDSMLYSSGTTGRPKGIKRPLSGELVGEGLRLTARLLEYGFSRETIYLSPAPIYHAAPFGFCMTVQSLGGTVVMMEKFDAVTALHLIEKYRITYSQWVPTMFIRLLKLPEADKKRWDLSSHQCAVHAAAPCPVEIKRQMIAWWGPILHEYYAGTEGNGSTSVTSEDWLARPGTVGQAQRGILHICDEAGQELPARQRGIIYFEMPEMPFEYYGEPEKTRKAQHPVHLNWSTLGDVGYLDEEGYLFLTDRKAYMIISGGINIYPQEIEDTLVLHPKVTDVAVFGVPNPEFGEEVKAVVQLASGLAGNDDLVEELLAFVRENLASFKIPRSIDFIDELPRLPTGKLYKRLLRDKYWDSQNSTII